MDSCNKSFELIFVDDGSQDGTFDLLSDLVSKDERVQALRMRSTFGEASALEAGLQHAGGQQIIYVSGRVRINPDDFHKLILALD